MANNSIKNAFERFWMHVTAAVGEKQDRISYGSLPPTEGTNGDIYIQTGVTPNLDMARYATETGQSGNWDYVKYSDGTVELWGEFDITGVNTSTTFGNVFRSSTTYSQTLPFTFASIPFCQVDISSPNDWALWKITHKNATTTTTSTVYVGRASSNTGIPVRFSYYVRGSLI